MRAISLLFLILCYCNHSIAEDNNTKKTICLNMIVKDESKVITRGLATVKPIIDHWVIVDTGSTDGTQEIIRKFMADIPGELHERPWKNFGHNRNEALDLARDKADYIMFMDADELLEFSSDFKMPPLLLDSYDCMIHTGPGSTYYARKLLIKADLDWKWHGVLHEYVGSPNAKTSDLIKGIEKISRREGARSADPQKYQKDAKILEEGLKDEPTNERYAFYLAQSYRDAGDYESSLKNYEKRVKMGGWDQETFCAMLQIGNLQEKLKKDPKIIIKSYLDAYLFRPTRAEPLFYLAKYYRGQKDFEKAYQTAKIGLTIPFPRDILFINSRVYDYDMLFECSISAYWIGKYDESQQMSQQLLAKPDLPENIRKIVEKNLAFANAKLMEKMEGEVSQ